MSWLSRLVLGSEKAAVEAAEKDFQKTLNGHKFEPEAMRNKLRKLMHDVEQKAAALSIPPPPGPQGEADSDERGHEPTYRREKVGAG